MSRARYAALPFTTEPDYAFPVPIVAAGWERLGYRPVLIATGRMDALGTAAIAATRILAPSFLVLKQGVPDGMPAVAAAKLTRYLPPLSYGVTADDYWVTGDADLLPVGLPHGVPPQWPEHGHLTAWNANLYDGTQWAPRWPACHLGATVGTWRSVVPYVAIDGLWRWGEAVGREPNGNISDELILRDWILAWQRLDGGILHPIERDRSGPMAARNRLERSGWRGSGFQTIDAHFPRPAWTSTAWARMRPYLSLWFSAMQMALEDSYQRSVSALMG